MAEDNVLLTVLLPVLIETAMLEIHEYMNTAESMTVEEVLALVENQKLRKQSVMGRLAALEAKIKAGG
jgi:hypothetical protein